MNTQAEIFKHRMMALLGELASKPYQTKVWAEGKHVNNGHSLLFIEAVIELFDDALVASALEKGAIDAPPGTGHPGHDYKYGTHQHSRK